MRVFLILILFASSTYAQTLENGCWFAGAPLPTARQEVQQVLLNGKIYVIGGFVQGGIGSDLVEVYDPLTDAWSATTPLPQRMHHIGAAEVNGKIYVLGGYLNNSFQPTNLVYEFDPNGSTWTPKAPMLKPRGAATASVVNGLIYVIGGVAVPDGVSDANEVYDAVNNTWTALAVIPTRREHLASATIGTFIYVAGGRNGPNKNAFEAYNTTTNTWTTLPNLPTARSGLTAAAYNAQIFVFGGEIPGVYSENEVYDTGTNSWTSAAPMPTPRHGIGSTFFNDAIYIIGGGEVEGFGVSTVNERFTLIETPFFDDFTDPDINDWTIVKGSWSASGGSLNGTNKRKGEIRSLNAGCACCTTLTSLQIITPGGRASLLTHYLDKDNFVEVLLKEANDKWIVKHWINGSIAAKSSVISAIVPSQTYTIQLEYVSGELQLTVDSVLLINLSTSQPEQGTVGFRVKSTTQVPATLIVNDISVD